MAPANPKLALRLMLVVSTLLVVPSLSAQNDFLRGDCDISGRTDIQDVIVSIDYAFSSGPPPPCLDACDSDGDGIQNLLVDAIYTVNYLFEGGAPPPPPFPECAQPPTSLLGCLFFDCDPTPLPPSDEVTLVLPQLLLDGGETAVAVVTFDIASSPPLWVRGVSYGVCHDTTNFLLGEVVAADDLDDLNGGNGPDFASLESYDGGFAQAIIVELVGGSDFPSGTTKLAEASYTAIVIEEVVAPLEFCETLGDPPVAIIAIAPYSLDSNPSLVNGSLTIGHAFRRGDVDANGTFNGLVDGLYLLSFGFQGGPSPPCLDAVDADDNGLLNSLVDGLALLQFAFLGGPMPAPALDCGIDPTADGLDCQSYDFCP